MQVTNEDVQEAITIVRDEIVSSTSKSDESTIGRNTCFNAVVIAKVTLRAYTGYDCFS